MIRRAIVLAVVALAGTGSAGPPARAAEGKLPDEWGGLWSRKKGAARATVEPTAGPDGKAAVRVEHAGERDWCLTRRADLKVREGDLIELTANLKLTGAGRAGASAITYDAAGKVRQWTYGSRGVRATPRWQAVRSRIVIPRGVVRIVPRLVGSGPATVWVHGFAVRKAGNVKEMQGKDLPASVSLGNEAISVVFRSADATLTVTDRRARRTWTQKPLAQVAVLRCAKAPAGLDAALLDGATSLELKLSVRLVGDSPELTVALAGDGELPGGLAFPNPFVTEAGTYLVVPMNEGISYPVDDASIRPRRLIAYGGHGICMAFWGATDGRAGHMAVIETPDDAAIRIARADGRLYVAPEWHSQRGQFGYERRLRYVFFATGGHVAMCKRYRACAKRRGTLKTLAEKRKDIPAVDRLVGAVNVWCWDRNAVDLVKEMQGAGIERILWSNRGSPETLRAMNALPGVLTSRYDIYQDVMNPANFKHLRGVHGGWPTEAWPKDLMLDAAGQWRPGWRVRGKDGKMYPCGVVCDRQAVAYAEKRVPEELKTHPYRCRFIDTTTASSWRECYHPDHPMTRSDSRVWKMKLLGLMSEKFKLVTGSETGHDAAVPFVHYFEGMLSLGPYRVPDAGRDMARIWQDVPERVAKFQLGQRYRLPLWELVYHDCVVAQWYWGDYNNKLPSLWRKRDLFNALYGTPPMFMFRRAFWRANKDRFAKSYLTVCPVARATGYAEMADHRFLTADRDVQQTRFANGVTVTVNFGADPHALPDGTKVAPMGCHVAGMKPPKPPSPTP